MKILVNGFDGKVGTVLCPALEAAGHTLVTTDADAEVMVDFTAPEVAVPDILRALEAGVPCIVGTSGWDTTAVDGPAKQAGLPVFFAPNFAIGAVLGMRRGALSQLTYWFAGLVGLPFYSGGAGGWEKGTGATMGYLVGFVVAAGAIGYLAEKKHDRNFATSLPAMLLGSTIIYAFGATWLSIHLNLPLANGEQNAISLGVAPFLVGDLLKALVAAGCTTSVWAAISKSK